MIVQRSVNIDLQTYRAWVQRNDIEPQVAARPHEYLNRLNFATASEGHPTEPRKGYPASSGVSAAAVSAHMLTGEPSLA